MNLVQLTDAQKQRYEQLFAIAANDQPDAADEDIISYGADQAAWFGLTEEWPELSAYDGAAPEGACQHCKGPAAECGGKTFNNHYKCSECGTVWNDPWCGACNDRCPTCDTETEPEPAA